ncbi:mono(ADP-ribosyl)transferase SpvB [Aspergillus udagawae]|uniref:Mono(ADP-ribosyl)transferase SpvB n=1 Tax=Aspergillus udagawae TaxID=91492 RepID=A0A8E0QR16_9EURO|nr:uncharacterized protein Aud_005357 [Aspergillus udagawae]GFF22918.1 mono(ADP-ribosyl)transferase SpvB [Aspergillus udagawae]GFF96930.1 mono(ADP-ribosyl)transferase SpvB [Aspergillus udagawae]GIC88955.1 hypothetical protein Aud_005357 [Aspergillus udagawae]
MPAKVSQTHSLRKSHTSARSGHLETTPGRRWARSNWMFEVVLDYGEHHASVPRTSEDTPWSLRQDSFSTANAGFEVRTYRLCRPLLMFHHLPEEQDYPDEVLVSSTSLMYKESG